MKKSFLLLIVLFSFAVLSISCKKEGSEGPKGSAGINGADGKDGTNGTNGADGKDGTNGTNGADGKDGINGIDGINGYGSVTAADIAAYDLANGARGGILYDNWTSSESGIVNIPAGVTAKSEFFRCKSCHAWDGLGNKGSYINRAGTASRPNCASVDLRAFAGKHSITETFLQIKNAGGRAKSVNTSYGDNMPDYSNLMSDADIWDLVKYLYTETINVSLIYDYSTLGLYPTGTIAYSNIGKDGNVANGNAYYNMKCLNCHGLNGKDIAIANVGKLARTKPNEVWHKVKFGQLGSSMHAFGSSLQNIKDLYIALQDTVTYPN